MLKDKRKGLWQSRTLEDYAKESEVLGPTGVSCNEPFGSRPEPGVYLIASILLLPPGEVPEGKAGSLGES
jgi:hypothetical protein